MSDGKFLIPVPLFGLLCFILLLGAGSGRVQAQDIRVLLLDKLDAVTVTAAESLRIGGDRGNRLLRLKGDPIRVRPAASGGIWVNGTLHKIDHLVFRSSREIKINKTSIKGEAHVYWKGSGLAVVEVLDVEDYLKGVLGQEMPWDWEIEALKAQAVAARTYALHQKGANQENIYDVGATTDHQVYNSQAKMRPPILKAVEETRGMVLVFEDRPILAAYHSSCGGKTEDVKDLWGLRLPYLQSVSCPYDVRSPHHSWRKQIDLDRIEKAIRAAGYPIGTIASITPYHRNGSGRVDKMRILHSRGELYLAGGEFRKLVGYEVLPSAAFQVETLGSKVDFTGKGRGHGVGFCQWGAKGMAEEGHPFKEILAYYYSGTEIVVWRNDAPL
ncbi:MAG: SpoIID/LytB domain-containing protein [Nitrospirae bacterium]|nr:SpoIID/LytB domain-containing protein [Nitrospirota bacterium]